jgi:hypothetical protein
MEHKLGDKTVPLECVMMRSHWQIIGHLRQKLDR